MWYTFGVRVRVGLGLGVGVIFINIYLGSLKIINFVSLRNVSEDNVCETQISMNNSVFFKLI